MSKVIRIELTAIYLAAALLVLAVGRLVGGAVTAEAADPFPTLRVSPPGEDFVQPEQKTVYFTFDDGPSRNTEKILDMLERQQVKATFFVTAQNAGESYAEELLRRIVDEGHTLGLHTYSHDFHEIYSSPESYLKDLEKLNDYLYETVGVRPDILRFAGGSATINASPGTMKTLIRELTGRGYLYYDWDVVSGDDTPTVFDAEYLAERMVKGTLGIEKDSVVILLHDSPAPVTSAEAVELVIGRLREEGYAFDCLSQQVEPVHLQTKRFTLD